MPPAAGVSEREIIGMVREALGPPKAEVLTGIGDDCAVLTAPALPGRYKLATTDTLVEGVHFDLSYMTLADVGWKALAVNVSDVLAMAGTPRLTLATLGFPAGATKARVRELLTGVVDCASAYAVQLVGGDTFRAPQWQLGFTVLGTSSRQPVLRSGAQPGDLVCHTGVLGLSEIGLHLLWAQKSPAAPELGSGWKRATTAHCRPCPAPTDAHLLQAVGATAALDSSDSVAQCLLLLAQASLMGLQLDFRGYTFAPELDAFRQLCRAGARAGFDVLAAWNPTGESAQYASLADLLLASAEDYGLLFTASPGHVQRQLRLGQRLQVLGKVMPKEAGCFYLDETGQLRELKPVGWSHS